MQFCFLCEGNIDLIGIDKSGIERSLSALLGLLTLEIFSNLNNSGIVWDLIRVLLEFVGNVPCLPHILLLALRGFCCCYLGILNAFLINISPRGEANALFRVGIIQ